MNKYKTIIRDNTTQKFLGSIEHESDGDSNKASKEIMDIVNRDYAHLRSSPESRLVIHTIKEEVN